MIKLSDATLPQLPDTIARPGYDRNALSAGILHIGVGNFHRAHLAWYMHRLFQRGMDHDWAIVGSGVRTGDEIQRQRLAAQDYLTCLIELHPEKTSAEITGPMIDFLPVQPDNRALINRMAQPDIRIVSMTVTEGGYFINPATRAFDTDHPDIRHDTAHPTAPRTAFGAMIAALRLRRDQGHGPLSMLCCDNLQSNGAVLRQTVVSLAELTDPDLADWINTRCSFPNAMVDCIVPATGPREIALAHGFGIDDTTPVTHEDFRQWVIEDDFCAGRPDWEQVGVTLTDNVHGYEMMKIRLLNGGHQVIANIGELLSIETIAACMDHTLLERFFDKLMRNEVAPHVPPVPEMTPGVYLDLITGRFGNANVVDTVRRVAFEGSARHPGFVVPSIQDGLASGMSVSGLALVEAVWARMCFGVREDGSSIEPNDPRWTELQETAIAAKNDPVLWLQQGSYYGDLATNPQFAEPFAEWLGLIWDKGVETALHAYCTWDAG